MSASTRIGPRKFGQWITPNRDKIYIIPTRMGGYFITVTLIILLVGSGYSNNLVNMLAFFMLALVFVGMVMTNLQLKDVTVVELEMSPAFADGEVWSQALVHNANAIERYGLRVYLPELLYQGGVSFSERFAHQVRARQNARVSWVQRAATRGLHSVRKIELSSVFPLGFFYSWKVIPIQASYWVYPALVGEIPLPEALKAGDADAASRSSLGAGDDFRGHRKYATGDSSRHIDWKAHARGRPLMVKEINEGDPPDWLFDFRMLDETNLDLEAKLSQLAVWVNVAFQHDLNFALQLPGTELISGRGDVHARKCFEALAVFR
jgi:uncharacterized protein (DUF58 family)